MRAHLVIRIQAARQHDLDLVQVLLSHGVNELPPVNKNIKYLQLKGNESTDISEPFTGELFSDSDGSGGATTDCPSRAVLQKVQQVELRDFALHCLGIIRGRDVIAVANNRNGGDERGRGFGRLRDDAVQEAHQVHLPPLLLVY